VITDRAALDRLIAYHGRIARAMTAERTALTSALIPVTPYILVACVEAYRRWPEMIRVITGAADPAVIGASGRRPGSQVDAVRLWSLANLPLVGRQVLRPLGGCDPQDDAARLGVILGLWEPAARAFRGDGHRQAADAGLVVRRYDPEVIETVAAGLDPVTDPGDAARRQRDAAALAAYAFLCNFDTRAGYQDSGPYPGPAGTQLIVRDVLRIGPDAWPWTARASADLPVGDVTVAFAYDDGVRITCNDWGTSRVQVVAGPDDPRAHLCAAGAFLPRDGRFVPLPPADFDDLVTAVRAAQRTLYREIAAMDRNARIDAGALVYFSFLRPFAAAAGVDERLDWRVPLASTDLYPLLCAIEETPEIRADDPTPYYAPLDRW